ncbi:hypothetical protein ACVV38_06390 [Escherichia coli]
MPLIFIEVKNPTIGKASSQNATASTNALKTPNSNASPTSPSS